jgi:hypothetical protein
VVVLAALIATLLLAVMLRRRRAFVPSLLAFGCLAATQVIFWSLTYPVNRATVNWTMFPPNWAELRAQWEYSHAAAAALNLIALISTILAALGREDGRRLGAG